MYGHLECLKYAHENDCSWDEKTTSYATFYRKVDCLKYAHENGCPWDYNTCTSAISQGNLECLRYAHENGCSWDHSGYTSSGTCEHIECIYFGTCLLREETYVDEDEWIGEMLNIELEYFHNDYDSNYEMCQYARYNGYLDCLKYAYENNCPWIKDTSIINSIRNGQIENRKYYHKNGCPWNEEICLSQN